MTKIFPTKERVPYLVFLETISKEEIGINETDWENDVDYLRCQYDLYNHDNLAEKVSEDI